jgi:hypothetical protein
MRRILTLAVILIPLFANAANVTVNCNLPAPMGRISTALKFINPAGPNTITVTGTCKENLWIQGFDRLTLIAKPGASITDASGGQQWAVIYVTDSRRVSIQGFTISGGNVGVRCEDYSLCRFSGNTITGTTQRGVDLADSDVTFSGDIIQNNTGQGIYAQGSHITAMNITLKANQTGLTLFTGTLVGAGWSVSNNTQDGIFVGASNFQLIDSSISSNGWNGIDTTDLSDLSLVNLTVTANGFDGIYIGETTVGWFSGGSYAGNGYVWGAPDIGCAGTYSFANNIAGLYGTTNCPVTQAAAAKVQSR